MFISLSTTSAFPNTAAIGIASHQPHETAYISGLLAPVSTDDLFSQSSLVVRGQVSGRSDSFQIQSPSGSVANFTDYYFTIDNILRAVLPFLPDFWAGSQKSMNNGWEALDVSRQAVSKWERGIASPSMENLVCMGRLLA